MGRIRQRLSRLLIFPLAVIIVSLAVFLGSSREPVHQGKRLSTWLKELENEVNSNNGTLSRTTQVAMAIRKIGTNGWTTLLAMLSSEDSALRSRLVALVRSRRLIPIDLMTAEQSRSRAHCGLVVLRDAARPIANAVMELTKHRNPEIRGVAVSTLAFMDPPVREVLPCLIDALEDPSWEVRERAANALRNIDIHKRSTEFALNRVIPESELKAAIPALKNALRDPRLLVRQSVASALEQIDPQAADAAGLK